MKTAKVAAFLADHYRRNIAETWAGGADDFGIVRRRKRGGRPRSNVLWEVKIAEFIEMELRNGGGMKNALHKANKKFKREKSTLYRLHKKHKSLFQ
jgi:hypothetical protein